MFDTEKVRAHFLRFTGLTDDQGDAWSGLCGAAVVRLAKRLREGVDPDSEVDRERLALAAAACACHAWRLLQREYDVVEERIGDIAMKYEKSARSLEDYYLAQVADLLKPESRPLIRVES